MTQDEQVKSDALTVKHKNEEYDHIRNRYFAY